MTTNDFIKEVCKEYSNALANVGTIGAKRVISEEINCTDLDAKFIREDIRNSEKFKNLFSKLEPMDNNPCLYLFELQSNISPEIIVAKIQEFAKNNNKVIPAIKKNFPTTNILYVGKVNKFVVGRLTTHLGFHTNEKNGVREPSNNHGLQLYYWAKDLELKLKLYVFEFEPDMVNLMEVIETQIANHLHPIIGKHK